MTSENINVKKPAATIKRKKGRPSASKSMVGKEILIEITCELLSKLPPQAVTRVEVAKSAGVDPSLIRYYFKNRSALILAAFEQLTNEYNNLLTVESAHFDNSPEGRLRSRVSAIFRLVKTYPHYHRLLIEEIAPMNTPESNEILSKLTQNRVDAYRNILTSGVEENVFKEVDVPLTFIAIIGMANFFTSGAEVVKIATGKEVIDDALAEQYQNLICDILLNGLKVK